MLLCRELYVPHRQHTFVISSVKSQPSKIHLKPSKTYERIKLISLRLVPNCGAHQEYQEKVYCFILPLFTSQ